MRLLRREIYVLKAHSTLATLVLSIEVTQSVVLLLQFSRFVCYVVSHYL